MLPQQPARLRDLRQAGFTTLQLCLWQGEAVGGSSDGTGTRCSELLATTPAHAAHGSGGQQEPAAAEACLRSLPASACQICFPSCFPAGCRLLPGFTHLRFWDDGLQPPQAAAPCCDQTSLSFLLRIPALAEPFLTAAFPSQQLALLHSSCS